MHSIISVEKHIFNYLIDYNVFLDKFDNIVEVQAVVDLTQEDSNLMSESLSKSSEDGAIINCENEIPAQSNKEFADISTNVETERSSLEDYHNNHRVFQQLCEKYLSESSQMETNTLPALNEDNTSQQSVNTGKGNRYPILY